jgi:flagellar motility protein MotE (MotC chaperone)
MPDEYDRRQIEVDRADRQVIEQAAAQLRYGAILDGYAGMPDKHIAFALALILDEIARHFRDLDEDLRARILDGCGRVLGQR